MEEGPWNYRGYAAIITLYDGFTKPSQVKLDTLELWAKIHDLPDGYCPRLKSLPGTIEEVVFMEPKSHDFEGNFYKVRIKINVFKPLKNVVSMIEANKRQIFRVSMSAFRAGAQFPGILATNTRSTTMEFTLPRLWSSKTYVLPGSVVLGKDQVRVELAEEVLDGEQLVVVFLFPKEGAEAQNHITRHASLRILMLS